MYGQSVESEVKDLEESLEGSKDYTTEKDTEILEVSEKGESKDELKDGIEEEKSSTPEKSPLSKRNISRIDDKPKRIQPKYGWL